MPLLRIITIVAAFVLMVILWFLVNRTRTGKAMRATSYDREAAAMMGIDIDRVIVFTFILGSALAGAAGVMFALRVPTNVSIGFIAGLKGFIAAVIGGIGSIPGAMAGGLILGFLESYIQGYVRGAHPDGTQWSDLYVFSDPDRVDALPPPGPVRAARHPEGLTCRTRRHTGSTRRVPKARRSGRTSGSRVMPTCGSCRRASAASSSACAASRGGRG